MTLYLGAVIALGLLGGVLWWAGTELRDGFQRWRGSQPDPAWRQPQLHYLYTDFEPGLRDRAAFRRRMAERHKKRARDIEEGKLAVVDRREA